LSSLRPTARVARGATYLFIQGFATALIGVVYFIVLARLLTQAELGVFALLSFILLLPQVFGTFALPSAAIKYISQYLAENSREKALSVIVRVLQVCLLSSLVAVVVLVVPAEWLSARVFGTADYAALLRIVGFSAVFTILNIATVSFLQGLQRMGDVAAVGLTYNLVQNGVGIFLLFMGWRLYAVVLGWFLGLLAASVLGLVLTARHLGIIGKAHPTKPLLVFSLPLYVSGGLGLFVTWADQLILVSYMSLIPPGASEAQRLLGIYSVPIRASIVPTLFSNSLITALFPQLSELYAQQGVSSLKTSFTVSARYSTLIGFPLIVGLAALAYPTIILFTGWSKADGLLAATVLIIISVGALASTLGVATGPILMTLERTAIVSVISVVSMAASIFLSYFTLAHLALGMTGTAWARTAAAVVGLVLSLWAVRRHIPVSLDKEALWKSSVASVVLVAAIVVVDLLRRLVSSAPYEFLVIKLHQLPIYAAVGGLAYFFALVALHAIKTSDVKLVEEYLPKRFRYLASWLERFAVRA